MLLENYPRRRFRRPVQRRSQYRQNSVWMERRTIRAIHALLFTGDGESHLEDNFSINLGR